MCVICGGIHVGGWVCACVDSEEGGADDSGGTARKHRQGLQSLKAKRQQAAETDTHKE